MHDNTCINNIDELNGNTQTIDIASPPVVLSY